MRVASRFSIAVHVLSLIGVNTDGDATSEWMAGSIGVNPVIVRNVMSRLRRAGLVATRQGVAGAHLVRPLSNVTLLDVYRAVDAVEEGGLFAIHENPNPQCPVGANIQGALNTVFIDAQRALENSLAATTVAQVVQQIQGAAELTTSEVNLPVGVSGRERPA